MALQSSAAILADLVADLTRLSPQANAQEFKKSRDHALRAIKSNQYGRTNQFEVDSELRGLLEKFRILNRDDLAEGLEENWRAFAKIPNKYSPEILAFLLHLSNNPAGNNSAIPIERYEDSDAPPLTYEEILRDDPYSDEEIWLHVDYSEKSSDSEDDATSDDKTPIKSKEKGTAESSSLAISQLILSDNEDPKRPLQFWKSPAPENENLRLMTELDAIRESIHMLRGLPTTLFQTSSQGQILPVPNYTIKQISIDTLDSLMTSFAELGTVLTRLRIWAATRSQQPLSQSIRATVEREISDFDTHIDAMESTFTNNDENVITSLIQVLDYFVQHADSLLKFDTLVERLDNDAGISHLELLHEECFFRQLASNDNYHVFLANMFLSAFRIYLRPVRRWMEDGELDTADEGFFIVERKFSSNKDASIWHDQVTIRKPENEESVVPKFMTVKMNRILNAGKSVRFLKKLGYDTRSFDFSQEPKLNFSTICRYETELDLFDARFDDALNRWIESKYIPSSSLLQNILMEDYHLLDNLDALRQVYFVPNGLIFQSVFDPVFNALDSRQDMWNDQYLLQERLRAAFGGMTAVESLKLSVRTSSAKSLYYSIKSMSTINIDYQLPWPLLNVIRKSSTSFYQKIFKLLLQIYRAKYLLRQTAFLRDNRQSHTNQQSQRTDPMTVALYQELNFFVDVLHTHLVNSVLEPSFESMVNRMKSASDLDEMTQVHDGYISSLLAQCLLIKNLNPIHNAVISILEIVGGFAGVRRKQMAVDTESKSDKKSRRRGRRRALSMKAAEWAKQVLKEEEESSSDDEDPTEGFNDSYDADTETLAEAPANDEEKLAKMHKDFEHLHNFVMTGLRGITRSGGEATWEMLADQLDWAGPMEQNLAH